MKICVISLQVVSPVGHAQDPDFSRLIRLEQSLKKVGFEGDLITWCNEYPDGSPLHMDSPWGFKAFCLQDAKSKGYDVALWLDSSAVIIRPIEHIFNLIKDQGYAFFSNHEYMCGEWCADETLMLLDVSREEALGAKEINAAAIGMDFSNIRTISFLDRLTKLAADGASFRGVSEKIVTIEDFEAIRWNYNQRISSHPRVKGHRHDQSVSGLLVHQMKLEVSEGYVTDGPHIACSDPSISILIVRDKDATLGSIRRSVFVVERIKSLLRPILKFFKLR